MLRVAGMEKVTVQPVRWTGCLRGRPEIGDNSETHPLYFPGCVTKISRGRISVLREAANP